METKRFTAESGTGDGVYNKKKENFTVSYYKKNQMTALYPAGGFSVVGQIGKGREEIGTITCGAGQLPVYAVSKLPHTKILGYIQVGEKDYVSIVKDVLLLWLFWIVLAAALLVGLAFLLKAVLPTGAAPEVTTRAPGVIDANAVLGEGELSVPEKIDVSGRNITVNGVPEMHLVAGQREQNYVFSNPENNPCFFVIEMELADTGEILYTSNLLPPGYSISKFTLNRPLEAGTYNVILHYKPTTFDQEQRPLNNMDIKTTVIAEAPAQ